MATQSPLSGLSDAAGGVLLPPEQASILTVGLLKEAGVLQLAGDSRATGSRRTVFPIWQGQPTATFVAEAGTKPVTGGEFAAGTLNIQKIATIVVFTDDMLEDLQSGDLNVLVDSGIRQAIKQTVENDAVKGSVFDSQLSDTTQTVTMTGTTADSLALAISAAKGSLETNGYLDHAALVPPDLSRYIRDARSVPGGGSAGTVASSQAQYVPLSDPLYGTPSAPSTELDRLSGAGTVAYVFNAPNVHVRVRKDVTVKPSSEATIGGTSLYQTDMTAARYVTRLGIFIHDINRAVVKITK